MASAQLIRVLASRQQTTTHQADDTVAVGSKRQTGKALARSVCGEHWDSRWQRSVA